MKGVATGVVLTILAGGGIRAVQFYRSGEILSDVSFTQKVKYLENMIDEEYLGDISTDDLKEGVYAGLIYGLDDVYSRYYTKEQYDQENATTEGSYVGIGVSMQQNAAGGVQIVECYKGSTAEEAGIKAGDVIEIKEKHKGAQRYKDILEVTDGRLVPDWLEADHEKLSGVVKEIPTREQIDVPVNEVLIVELYSK